MRRSLSALGFCVVLLLALSYLLLDRTQAKEDPIAALLELPAPPPPNPLAAAYRSRDKNFYDKFKPPSDDAPIEELLDYWKTRSDSYAALGANPSPSERTLERIKAEIEKNHDLLTTYVNIFPDGEESAKFMTNLLENEGAEGAYDKDERAAIHSWLKMHTALYSSELAKEAEGVRDSAEYLTSQDELLALTRVDFEKAEPIINRLYGDSTNRVSQVLAKWALYRHALDTNSIDVDRYRDELKAVVGDRSATPGMRDLALDALSKEKEWPGRDEWYFSLFDDETLIDLKVNGASYTGLTTLMYYVPDDKFTDRLLELLKSDNKAVRANAVRNLLLKLDGGKIEVVRALVPLLDDPSWAQNGASSRYTLVSKLGEVEVPESVPGLIRILDEKRSATVANANTMASNSAVPGVNVANMANTKLPALANTNSAYAASYTYEDENVYPLRSAAVTALGKQKDPRAVPALRRVLGQVEYYEQSAVVRAMIACKGFTVAEQLDGLELAAKSERATVDGQPLEDPLANLYRYSNSNAANVTGLYAQRRPPSAFELKAMVGRELLNIPEIPDDLARAVVDRIEELDKSNRPLADAFRKMALRWQSGIINSLMLRDLKNGRAGSEAIVKLLTDRKELREKQSPDVFELRNGTQTAAGILSCIAEDKPEAASLIENGSAEARSALLACARLVRLPLPLDKVAANLSSATPLLAKAAELYLESEDSAAARNIILARHPGEARILGATTAFFVDDQRGSTVETLYALFQSLGDNSLYNGWSGSGNDDEILKTEKALQEEVKKSADLVAVYSFDGNFVRIYKDKAVYSWAEDASRFRERPLAKNEFEELTAYIRENKLDELPPFLSCGGEYCLAKELVMLSRAGGRRVYMSGETHRVFEGLAKIFNDWRKTPGVLRYELSREVPGLEIVIAADNLHVETVWKEGSELRIAASDPAIRKRVSADIEAIAEDARAEDGAAEKAYQQQTAMAEKRKYEGFAWYRITERGAEPGAAQPAGASLIPPNDAIEPRPTAEGWKGRSASLEIRTSADGLYKVTAGHAVRIKRGAYQRAVVTANGRWVVASKGDEESGAVTELIRIDLLSGKEWPINTPENPNLVPTAYVPSLNRVLLTESTDYYDEEYEGAIADDSTPDDAAQDRMLLLDPATGAIQPVAGEFRPIAQQTFRQLQTAGRPDTAWAAIYDIARNVTEVGTYDMRNFTFRPVLRVPKIKFNSMSMYVDEPAGKVYFVYRGHLLSLPLAQKPAALVS